MSEAGTSAAEGARSPVRPAATLYRYFFYGWLFRDAGAGSAFERAAALRHNRASAHWLATYLRRWLVAGMLILAMERWSGPALGSTLLSAALAVALVLVIVFLLVTAVCWTLLRARWPA